MRYRYLIEHAAGDQIYCSTIEAGADSEQIGTVGTFESVEQAKLAAETEAGYAGETLSWKDAPKAWQPDAILVSQVLDDGEETSRDS